MSTLETIHKRLIRLNVIRPVRTKIYWFFIIGIIVNVIAIIITPIVWMILNVKHLETIEMVISLFLSTFKKML